MGDVFKGDERSPGVKESSERIASGFRNEFPRILKTLRQQIPGFEEMLLGTQQELSPAERELEAQLFETFAPRYGAAEGAAEKAYLDSGATQAAEGLAREFDPEYYNIRAKSAGALEELLAGGLTGGEETSIERGLNRSFVNRGVDATPSNTNQFEAAANYGMAARDRLGQALTQATSALPALKSTSGALIQQGAKGTTGQINNPLSRDVNRTAENLGALGGGFLDNQTRLREAEMGINANRRTVADHVNQAYSSATGVCSFTTAEAFYGRVPWYVRRIRDDYYAKEPKIAKGYLRMCRVVVPLMRRWSLFRDLMMEILIKPLTAYGGYITSTKGYEHGKHNSGILKFWLTLWKTLGKF